MALAAHEIILRINDSAFSSNYTAASLEGSDFSEAKDVTLSNSADILDTTAFEDENAFRTKLSGLKDASLSFSANFTDGDANGTVANLFTHLSNGVSKNFFVGLTGTAGGDNAGFSATGIIESIEITGAVDGLVEASISVQLSGAPVFLS